MGNKKWITKKINNLKNNIGLDNVINRKNFRSLFIIYDDANSRNYVIKFLHKTIMHGDDFHGFHKIFTSNEKTYTIDDKEKFLLDYARNLPPLSMDRILVIDNFSLDYIDSDLAYAAFRTILMYANDFNSGLKLIVIGECDSSMWENFTNHIHCSTVDGIFKIQVN